MSTTTISYRVEGMTCEHCVNSVATEVGRIGGVTAVEVDLVSGIVNISSTGPVSDEAVRAAVDEAGYEVVS